MPSSNTRRRSRRTSPYATSSPPSRTSLPTGRAAYADTRLWLLKRHGPICAYCGTKVAAKSITLDHVTPRRGQTAYDRRDNLVLACRICNAAKADKPAMVFLLGDRKRAANLARYGDHLSPMLLDLALQLTRPEGTDTGDVDDDSPYLDC